MIVSLFKSARRSRRPVPRQRSVFVEAAQTEKDIARQLVVGLQDLRGAVDLDELATVLQLARTDEVLSVVDAAGIRATFAGLEPELLKAAKRGAKTALSGQAVVLDAARPKIQAWLKDHAAELVKQTMGTSREAIKSIVTAGVNAGRHPKRLARDIRAVVGLTDRDALAVDRRRETLLSQGEMSATRAHEIADDYAEKLLKRRAENIARTESLTAVNRGRSALWDQLQEDGVMPEGQLREWDASMDGAVCEMCQAMHRKKAKVGEPWVMPDGTEVISPPGHPQCRCTELLA